MKHCKDCNIEYLPTGTNHQRCSECSRKRYRAADKERYARLGGKKNKKQTEKQRVSRILRKYNLTEDQFNQLFEEQQGKCAICGKHQVELSRSLAIDHCHTSGTVRGLLCMKCNLMLGYAEDNVEVLLAAISYLNSSS